MLTNKVYTGQCVVCGTYKETSSPNDICARCRGLLRIIDRVGKCVCGTEVWFNHWTNTCEGCGRDYDRGGHELAPREFWGEETGESPADVARIR